MLFYFKFCHIYYYSIRYDEPIKDEDFDQPGQLWREVLDEAAQARLVENIAGNLKLASDFIQERAVNNYTRVDKDFGARLAGALNLARRTKANL